MLLTVGSSQLVSVSRGGNRFGFAGVKEAQVDAVKLGVKQLGCHGGSQVQYLTIDNIKVIQSHTGEQSTGALILTW